ncbi:MAG TPA: cysteine--tRNA ligase, partial [Anaerolineaceae bacterium]|nr:cysteine--tRNA ligase [Anaerolineaceae bacterium]
MALRIYNTLTHKKEDFETLEPGIVRMYVCGPTVYSKAHVGHAMSAMVFDIIRRYLEYHDYEMNYLLNFTDVDDKIIARANQQGADPFKLAEEYIHDYEQNLSDLNIKPATFNPRATQEIDQILEMISGLIEKGYAYPADGDVYFRVTKDEDYGRLSGRKLEDMQAGARISVDERKEHPMDFALWKAARPDEPAWDSPWGKGRPGWHIECSAMNLHHLGEQIDIHGGGNDLVFPHHENEIAQTESLTGKPFARYWVHNGMLQLGGEKMAKSTGNLVTIEEFLSQYSSDTLRFTVLNANYRGPLTFNDEVLAQSEKALERLSSAFRPALP